MLHSHTVLHSRSRLPGPPDVRPFVPRGKSAGRRPDRTRKDSCTQQGEGSCGSAPTASRPLPPPPHVHDAPLALLLARQPLLRRPLELVGAPAQAEAVAVQDARGARALEELLPPHARRARHVGQTLSHAVPVVGAELPVPLAAQRVHEGRLLPHGQHSVECLSPSSEARRHLGGYVSHAKVARRRAYRSDARIVCRSSSCTPPFQARGP